MKAAAALALGIPSASLICELGLRALGLEPARRRPIGHPEDPVVNEPDPELGWRSKEGRYLWRANHAVRPPIQITHWSDGLRATAPERTNERRRIVVLG